MAKEINALDLRKRFGEIMEEVRYRKEPYVVKRNGRAMIVLVDIETYEASKENLKEEAFIEEYTDERIAEFAKEDAVDEATRGRVQKILKSK